MGFVTINFLGEEYKVSEAINEFLHYDELLTPIRVKIINALAEDISRDSRVRFGEGLATHVNDVAGTYINFIRESANLLVNELFALGIYDVTADELLTDISSISDIGNLSLNTLNTILSNGRRLVNLQEAGINQAYRSAASNITGSGVMVFSSSITTLLVHSMVERGIIMSQAKKADKAYAQAVREITSSTRRAIDTMASDILVTQYYPALMDILMEFSTKIMSHFLEELIQHQRFDFASIEKYDMQKAEQMLTNINRVPDKTAFLRQTFNVCPFCLGIYEKCLEHNLLDRDTFQTAAYFGFADHLAENMEAYINQKLYNRALVNPIVSILAEYKNTNETGIWREIYKETIETIENAYRRFNRALTNKSTLDGLIREYIAPDTMTITEKTSDYIEFIVAKKIIPIFPGNRILEFMNMGLITADSIRTSGSTATSLNEINTELSQSLTASIMAYIEEAKQRLKRYETSKAELDRELHKIKNELALLKAEREKLGFFAFSRKKEMDHKIDEKTKQINEYERTHESKKLLDDFERMYK